MSSAGTRLQKVSADRFDRRRRPLAYLLHALNQPLTGLQCLLELALIGHRNPEEAMRTFEETLELTARIRLLVESVREISNLEESEPGLQERIFINDTVAEVVQELAPVAESRQLKLALESGGPLPVMANRQRVSTVVFRLLEAAVSVAEIGSYLRVVTREEHREAVIRLEWPEHATGDPFSRQELGLLLAEAGWRKMGAVVTGEHLGLDRSLEIRMPSALGQQEIAGLNGDAI